MVAADNPLPRYCVETDRRQRLIDFVRQGGCQLAQRGDPGKAR